jgi:hypothetical protein
MAYSKAELKNNGDKFPLCRLDKTKEERKKKSRKSNDRILLWG